MTLRRRRIAGWTAAVLLGGGLLAAIAFTIAIRIPIDEALLDPSRHRSVSVVARGGEVLYESLSSTGNRSEWIRADAIPAHVQSATLAAEDHAFFEHGAMSGRGILRAFYVNVKSRRVVQGGSTITQQVAKLLLQSRDRSMATKARESLLAFRLERQFSKREILAMYLNLAPYGNRIDGVGRASRIYFGIAPEQLTIAQAAYLASIPRWPGAFNPLRNPERAMQRQRYVLDRMASGQLITNQQHDVARGERLQFGRGTQPLFARHFVERVLAGGVAESGRIVTTLDAALQRDVQGIISARRDDLVNHGARSVAVAVLDNRSGEWLAWEGSGDYFGDGFGGAIDGVISPRQPGSTLKPFTYALAFEQGETPASVLADVPSHFPTAQEGIVYTPRNYDGRFRGPMRIRTALAGSENVPAVAMLAKLGPPTLLRFLRNAGFAVLDRTADYYGLGLTLGDAEVTLEQLVTAYSTFARGGLAAQPHLLRDMRLREPQRLLSERSAFWITDILADPNAREFIFGTGGSLDFPFPVAVKTGTSQAYRDNWTIGYTPEVTVGVWVGNFDRSELRGSSGVTGAAPIFNSVMLAAVTRSRGHLPVDDATPVLAPPDGVESVTICSLSGLRPSPYCPATEKEWLPSDAPARFCSWHHDGWIDWPADVQAWARASAPDRGAAPKAVRAKSDATFRIVNPAHGATFLIDPTLRMEYQTLRLRANADATWLIDGKRVPREWPLRGGRHTVTAIDARGRRDSVEIFVK